MNRVRTLIAITAIAFCGAALAEWDGVPDDSQAWWYQLYLAVIWIGIPLYVLCGWIAEKLRDRRALKQWRRNR